VTPPTAAAGASDPPPPQAASATDAINDSHSDRLGRERSRRTWWWLPARFGRAGEGEFDGRAVGIDAACAEVNGDMV
jgi:hypothetical protein